MQFKLLVLASVAAVAVAQTSTATSSCAAQNILDACKSSMQGQVNSCQANDWDCLCTQYGNLLTCYNVCPADPLVNSVQQQRNQYCAAASAYGTKTSSTVAAATTTGSTTATHTGATTMTTGTATAASRTSSSATATATANSAATIEYAGGMIAVLVAGLNYLA